MKGPTMMLHFTTPLALCILCGVSMADTAQQIPLARAGRDEVVIYVSEEGPGLQKAREIVGQFFEDRGVPVRTTAAYADSEIASASAVVVIETAAQASVAALLGAGLGGLAGSRPESFVLTSTPGAGKPHLTITGASDPGAEAGAVHLLSKLRYWEGQVSVETMRELHIPFLRGREATLTPTGRILSGRPELMKLHNYEHWDEARLVNLVDYVKACGFNSLQVMELLHYRDGTTREEVAPVLHTLANAAHERNLKVSQYIWGSRDTFHWQDPATRPAREDRYRGLAATYGPYVDHIITHWIDEGDEGGCQVPQEATVFLVEEYRKFNPNVRATFDTWGNDARSDSVEEGEGFWDSQEEPGFLDQTYSPASIGVALERWYNADQAALVARTGRALGIWGWYLGDYEMDFASHIETRVLDQYFTSLPGEAGQLVDWLSIERCFHALPADINWYVAGKKMWDPRRSLEDILEDYCHAVFGPQYGDVLVDVFRTVEAGQKDYKVYGYFIPESDRFPDIHQTEEYMQQAREALRKLDSVVLPDGWKPNFPTMASPEVYIASLWDSLVALSKGEHPVF